MEVGREDDRQRTIARTYLLKQGVLEKLKEGMLKTKKDTSSSCDGGRLGTCKNEERVETRFGSGTSISASLFSVSHYNTFIQLY
jgi:hypothetical protein